MTFSDDLDLKRLLPQKKQYSIVKLDTFEPPSSDDCAVKMYEVDDLSEASVADRLGTLWMAYDREGNATILGRGGK